VIAWPRSRRGTATRSIADEAPVPRPPRVERRQTLPQRLLESGDRTFTRFAACPTGPILGVCLQRLFGPRNSIMFARPKGQLGGVAVPVPPPLGERKIAFSISPGCSARYMPSTWPPPRTEDAQLSRLAHPLTSWTTALISSFRFGSVAKAEAGWPGRKWRLPR